MDQMTALVWKDVDKVEPQKTSIPRPQPGEALLRVHSAGICGSDLGIYAGKHPRATRPLIMGHEFSAEVVEIDLPHENHLTQSFQPGTRVVVEPLISCGHCRACRSGHAHVCENLGLYGIDRDGAFAEYVTVAADKLYAIPDGLDSRIAALTEPTAVAVHAVRKSAYKPGDTAAVLGGGPIGTLIALVLKLYGCHALVVSEPRAYRRELLGSLGIEALDPSSGEEAVEALRASMGSGGADVVFEVAGVDATTAQATAIARVLGNIVLVAVPKHPLTWDDVQIAFKELSLTGTRVYAPFDFERALELIVRKPDLFARLLSSPFSLTDGKRAFEIARDGEQIMRAVFNMH